MIAPFEIQQVESGDKGQIAGRLKELGNTISAFRLSTWLRCTLRFYFRYVLQIKRPLTPALYSGSAIHTVLQHWNMS